MCAESLGHVWFFESLGAIAQQVPLSMVFSRQYWCWLPLRPPGDLPDPGIEPMSPALASGFLTTELPGKTGFCKLLAKYFPQNSVSLLNLFSQVPSKSPMCDKFSERSEWRLHSVSNYWDWSWQSLTGAWIWHALGGTCGWGYFSGTTASRLKNTMCRIT